MKTPPQGPRKWNQHIPETQRSEKRDPTPSKPHRPLTEDEAQAVANRLSQPVHRLVLERDVAIGDTNNFYHAILRGGSPPTKYKYKGGVNN